MNIIVPANGKVFIQNPKFYQARDIIEADQNPLSDTDITEQEESEQTEKYVGIDATLQYYK